MNPKIAHAIATILGGVCCGAAAAAPAAAGDAGGGSLEEIIVTAQHRNEGMQDVPIAMQAFTEASLAQLDITSLRARYEFAFGDYRSFVQASAAHSGHSFTQAGANPTIAAQGFVSLFTNADQYIVAQTPMHPRVVGVKFGYSF